LWNDDAGALLATEWLFMLTTMVIGLTTGLAMVRNSVVKEMEEVANGVRSLDPSYSFTGLSVGRGRNIAHTAGSTFQVKRKTPDAVK
jgi:hypothetical protein